ncbi:MAG TPA: right-handed parallel beta-helix repeat-containing protein [Polyangiaceae bacterium]|nr:right-handed parallel beta-helix repeat-containing protein [Polyangiaceae bacterium]
MRKTKQDAAPDVPPGGAGDSSAPEPADADATDVAPLDALTDDGALSSDVLTIDEADVAVIEGAGDSTAAGTASRDGGTPVSGVVSGATWTADGSPYVLTGDVVIASLTIREGVTIQAKGDYALEVAGSLTAVGAKANPIVFTTTADNVMGWEGIFYNASQASELRYCVVERALNSAVRIVGSSPLIHNCTLRDNTARQGAGLFVSGAMSKPILRNALITGNAATDAFEAGGGVFVRDGATLEIDNSIISSNRTIYANARGGGIFVCGGAVTMANSVVVQNGGATYGSGSSGIAINTGGLTGCGGASMTISSSIVFDNTPSQILGSNAVVTHSDVQGGFPGTGNLSSNPLFSDSSYHLLSGSSPCIDTGDPSPTFDDCPQVSLGTKQRYGCVWRSTRVRLVDVDAAASRKFAQGMERTNRTPRKL